MDWPMHNLIADMQGPLFLLFYGGVIGFVLTMSWWVLHQSDRSRALPLPPIPSRPDPYEIAYLQGGEERVAHVATVNLTQRGYLRMEAGDEPELRQAPDHPDLRHLSPLERDVFDWFSIPRPPREISSSVLPDRIRERCQAYEMKLCDERLLQPPDVDRMAWKLRFIGALIIVGLGGYKLLVALSKGRTNVGFLILMGIAGVWILIKIVRPARLGRRGQEYLDQLRLAFEGLKERAPTLGADAAGSTLPLMVGLFGVGVLAGTLYDDYQRLFHRAAASTGSSGGWSSCSSCGASCGSCGGGGCGGGCGGCGGCGG